LRKSFGLVTNNVAAVKIQALLLAHEGRIQEAMQMLVPIPKNDMDSFSLLKMANLQTSNSATNYRRDFLMESLSANPPSAAARVRFGERFLARGRFAEERVLFDEALKLNPEQIDAYVGLLAVERGLGRHRLTRSVELCTRILALAPEASPHVNEALSHLEWLFSKPIEGL
jgi:tetratricopeptide (TPR) repeat protein